MMSLPPISSYSGYDSQGSARLRAESDRQGITQSQGQEGVKIETNPSARFAAVEQSAKTPDAKIAAKSTDQSVQLPPPPPNVLGFDQVLSLQSPPSPSFAELDTDQDGALKNDELSSFMKSAEPKSGAEKSNAIFTAMDKDSDGAVSPEEKSDFDDQKAEGVVTRANQIRLEDLDQGIRAFQQASNQGLQQSFARQSGLKV